MDVVGSVVGIVKQLLYGRTRWFSCCLGIVGDLFTEIKKLYSYLMGELEDSPFDLYSRKETNEKINS